MSASTIVSFAIIVDVTVPESAAVMAVPEILVLAIAAAELISASTIVSFAIIVLVTVPVSPDVITVPDLSGSVIVRSAVGSVT